MISISPGGFNGFYMFGVSTYIKKHYDLSNYVFSGASAGAWNALLLTYKGDPDYFVSKLFEIDEEMSKKETTLLGVEKLIKEKLLNFTTAEDYDLNRLFIGVSSVKNFHFEINIFSDFENLEDAIDCCISSSHIPLITGGFLNKYRNIYAFDGGFCKYPYLNILESKLHITPNIWSDKPKQNIITRITDFARIFFKNMSSLHGLYDKGYDDSCKNSNVLDSLFK